MGQETRRALLSGASTVAVGIWLLASARAQAYVFSHDEQITYRFALWDPARTNGLQRIMPRGLLKDSMPTVATFQLLHPNPSPGKIAEAECRWIKGGSTPGLRLEVNDDYIAGDLPGRVGKASIPLLFCLMVLVPFAFLYARECCGATAVAQLDPRTGLGAEVGRARVFQHLDRVAKKERFIVVHGGLFETEHRGRRNEEQKRGDAIACGVDRFCRRFRAH